jgi:hypothetical protein
MAIKFGVEYWPNESEGGQWEEIDPLDFIRLVQKSPESNVEYDYESQTFTFWDEYGIFYG